MAASRTSPLRPSIRLSPAHSRENSRSTSPDRHPASLYQKIDPLLSNLSPESTLSALTSTEAVPSNGAFSHDVLSQSISQVSPAERALGIRAAIAAQNLNIWYKEVQSWSWPKQNDAKAGKGFVPPAGSDGASDSSSLSLPNATGVEYYGSLPAEVVELHEKRIEEIRDGMENLDVEELKEHVLNAHIPSRSRPSSSTSTVSVPPPLSYVQLSDFTAIVTATILRALPFLSRLSSLLTTWDVRLLVLRQIPGLLRELKSARSAVDSSLHALRTSDTSDNTQTRFSESHLRDEHARLESVVVAVGRRMDRVLDALEGRADSLPENWIDDLEAIESDFAAWVVELERYKLRTECLRTKEQSDAAKTREESKPEPEPEIAPQQPEPADEDFTEASGSEPQDRPPMETIKEESRPGSHASIVKEEPRPEVQQSGMSSGDNTTTAPAVSDSERSAPPTNEPEAPKESNTSEPINGTLDPQPSILVAEDLQTPTRSNYLHHPIDTPEQSPTRVPLPATPDVDNKENIPPPGFIAAHIQTPSPRESTPKPAPLAERSTWDDPFIQKPASPARAEPRVSLDTVASNDASKAEASTSIGSETNDTTEDAREDARETNDHDKPAWEKKSPVQLGTAPQVTQNANEVSSGPETEPKSTASIEPDVVAAPDAIMATPVRNPDSESPETVSQQLGHTQSPAMDSKTAEATAKPAAAHVPEQPGSSRKPLQSPIKLGKTRLPKPNPNQEKQKPRARRPSTGSVGSLHSDGSSLVSAPDDPETTTDSSTDARLPTSRAPPRQPNQILFNGNHLLREDRLRRFENAKGSSRVSPQQNRSVSLPLERFINEKLDLNLEDDTPRTSTRGPPNKDSAAVKVPPRTSSSKIPPVPRLPRLKSASDLKSSDQVARNMDQNTKAFGRNTALRAMHHQDQPKSARLRQRLTAHPSLESLGVKRQELAYVEEDEAEMTDVGSRASSPPRQFKKPRDQMDEKINSILNTLPGRIHLVDPNNEGDTSSSSSSMDRKMRERFLSESPHGPFSRSVTPAPSLTLMPATRRRVSHAHKMEDSCVKLYHLHHGGQTAPSKLFVRTVGEDGQRVMVRVGGGWADLGEYLREYVIHHGRRKVSETPRVEVQGLAPRTSPGYPSPGNTVTATAPSFTSGRATPSRPPSVISARPPSSLTVHKKRRGSNASDAVAPRSVTTGNLNTFTSPPTAPTGRRRLSVSSGFSVDTQSPAHPTGANSHESHSTPLGLAGPKPRSRHVSMSPEGEAWVEDVLQKTRRTSSLNPPPFPLTVTHDNDDVETHDGPDNALTVPGLPKVRSVSDISSIGTGTSRRVVLRGLGNRR